MIKLKKLIKKQKLESIGLNPPNLQSMSWEYNNPIKKLILKDKKIKNQRKKTI